MHALSAHDPTSLPWAARVAYTENSVPMMIGEGQWGSVTWASDAPLHAADPSTGNVLWMGQVQEHGQPAYYAMRLRVVDRHIAEVEAVIRGKGEAGPFGDPAASHDSAFEALVPEGERSTRARLIALANGYFDTIQLNTGKIYPADRVNSALSTHG